MRSNPNRPASSPQPARTPPTEKKHAGAGSPPPPEDGGASSTDRLLVLSDGLFAIVITLLVLDLKVPPVPADRSMADIGHALLAQWPQYFAYVLSFLNAAIMWANHVTLFRYIRRCDHVLTSLNTLLLLCISVTPFTASLLASYLPVSPASRQVGTLVFSGTLIVTATFYNALWFYASSGHRLIDRRFSPAHYRDISTRYIFGWLAYLVAFVLATVGLSTPSLIMMASLSVVFAFPYNANRAGREIEALEEEASRRIFARGRPKRRG
jgi:uncharacterized membrane protein